MLQDIEKEPSDFDLSPGAWQFMHETAEIADEYEGMCPMIRMNAQEKGYLSRLIELGYADSFPDEANGEKMTWIQFTDRGCEVLRALLPIDYDIENWLRA